MDHPAPRTTTTASAPRTLMPTALLLGLGLALWFLLARGAVVLSDERGPRALLAALTGDSRAALLVGPTAFASIAELAILVIAVLVGARYAVWSAFAVLVATSSRVGRSWRAGERLVATRAPALVRRAAAIGVGSALAIAVIVPGASAAGGNALGGETAGGDTHAPRTAVVDLGWSPTTTSVPDSAPATTPDPTPSATAPTAIPASVPATQSPQTAPGEPDDTSPAQVTVRAGDSLWSIASAALGPDATDVDIAASWPAWHEKNRDVVGPDADHIEPGQVLLAPTETGESR